jgi:hypothetical protein
MQSTQTLQQFTKIIKTETIFKSDLIAKLEGLGAETKWPNQKWSTVQAL